MDWTAQEKAIKKLTINQQRTIHKFQHDWLPTQYNLNKRYNTSNKCPFCKQRENVIHILRCTARHTTQQTFYQDTQQKLQELETEPTLQNIFLSLLQGHTPSRSTTETYYNWNTQLIQEQTGIGIDHLWKGFITQTWGDIQEQHYRQRQMPPQYTGTMWTHRIVTIMYLRALQGWHERNDKIYDNTLQQGAERTHLQGKISHLYRKHRHTPTILPQLFHRTRRCLLESNTRYLRRWLQIMEPIDANYEVEKNADKAKTSENTYQCWKNHRKLHPQKTLNPKISTNKKIFR